MGTGNTRKPHIRAGSSIMTTDMVLVSSVNIRRNKVMHTPTLNIIKSNGLNKPNINSPFLVLAGIKY